MYDKKLKTWVHEKTLKPEENLTSAKAQFYMADELLSHAPEGKETADAVYYMESAAKENLPEAAFAMGQMFEAGWGVQRNIKTAKSWYEKASGLGSKEAADTLKEMKRRRTQKILIVLLALVLLIAAASLAVYAVKKIKPQQGVEIKVHKNMQLVRAATYEEFNEVLWKLMEEHDNELVIAGKQSSNRLFLSFKGEKLDLSAFPAEYVVMQDEDCIVIQFDSEEEAKRCLEKLRKTKGVLCVDEDAYIPGIDTQEAGMIMPQSGNGYYTWGAADMKLDEMKDWLLDYADGSSVVVGVIDTGVEVNDETKGLILEGGNFGPSSGGAANGQSDKVGHGTLTSGIIIDCTRGLDVKILPINAMNEGTGTNISIVRGLKYAIDCNVDVINMSLGGSHVEAFHEWIDRALQNNIVVVVSAGNNGEDADAANHCPSHITGCIAVGAYDEEGKLAGFSNYGDSVDLVAPGVNIVGYGTGGQHLVSADGTSVAAPHVTALAAMMKLYMKDKTPAQIEKYIKDHCEFMGDSYYYGEGRCLGSGFIEK